MAHWVSRERVESASLSAHVQRTDVFDPTTREVTEGETVLTVSLGAGDQVHLASADEARAAAFALLEAADAFERLLGAQPSFKIRGPEFEPLDGTFSNFRDVEIPSLLGDSIFLVSAPETAPGWRVSFTAPNSEVSTEDARAIVQTVVSAANLADFLTREGI